VADVDPSVESDDETIESIQMDAPTVEDGHVQPHAKPEPPEKSEPTSSVREILVKEKYFPEFEIILICIGTVSVHFAT